MSKRKHSEAANTVGIHVLPPSDDPVMTSAQAIIAIVVERGFAVDRAQLEQAYLYIAAAAEECGTSGYKTAAHITVTSVDGSTVQKFIAHVSSEGIEIDVLPISVAKGAGK